MYSTFWLRLILALSLIGPVAAQPLPGEEFYDYLVEYLKVQNGYEGNSVKAGMFLGYIRGVLDALEGTALCPPNNVSVDNLVQQAIKYIHNSAQSQSRQISARTLIFEGLRDQFACQK